MTFRGGIEKPENLARSGGGGGGRIAAGGGIGTLLLVGLFLLMGGDPSDLGQVIGSDSAQNQQQVPSGTLEHCKTTDDANAHADCRVEFTAISVNQMWQEQLESKLELRSKNLILQYFHKRFPQVVELPHLLPVLFIALAIALPTLMLVSLIPYRVTGEKIPHSHRNTLWHMRSGTIYKT